MARRRGRAFVARTTPRAFLAAVTLLLVLFAAGCGRDDFKNDPRPPVPAEVAVKIANDGVGVSPKTFGAGLVVFTVANLTNQPGSLAIHGPVTATTDEIPPAGTGSVKVDLKSGNYEASVDGIAVRPFQFTVGPERASGQNDLLLP
jgi:hypothetical protein